MLSMVMWKRKVQEVNDQYRMTLPKRWIEDQDIEDKDEVEVHQMQRQKALKIKRDKNP